MKHEETYTSQLKTHVHFSIYEPNVVIRIKAVLFIIHDVREDMEKYDHFANYLSTQGYIVVVPDVPGHGHSLINYEQGYFGEENVEMKLMEDMKHLHEVVFTRYPDSSYFYMGCGFGASLVQLFASVYGDYMDGMILMGLPKIVLPFLFKTHLQFSARFHGHLHHSHKLKHRLLKHLSHSDKLYQYITSDENTLKDIEEDPFSNFTYSNKGLLDVIELTQKACKEEMVKKVPGHLSICLMSSTHDPLTQNGKVIKTMDNNYKKQGFEDCTSYYYKNSHHSLLFDKEKDQVYKDILDWLNNHTFLL